MQSGCGWGLAHLVAFRGKQIITLYYYSIVHYSMAGVLQRGGQPPWAAARAGGTQIIQMITCNIIICCHNIIIIAHTLYYIGYYQCI